MNKVYFYVKKKKKFPPFLHTYIPAEYCLTLKSGIAVDQFM